MGSRDLFEVDRATPCGDSTMRGADGPEFGHVLGFRPQEMGIEARPAVFDVYNIIDGQRRRSLPLDVFLVDEGRSGWRKCSFIAKLSAFRLRQGRETRRNVTPTIEARVVTV
jgi:hypothetical protein